MISRVHRFQFWMARLALAAILLMAVMPTISRWLQSNAAAQPAAAMMAAAHEGMAGMASHHHHNAGAGADSEQAPVPMGGMHDEACAYCPLLASLAPVLLALLVLLHTLRRAMLPAWIPLGGHALPQRLGLGARGPPLFL